MAQNQPLVESNICSSNYLTNATSVFIDLQFGVPDLMSVQAILAMVNKTLPTVLSYIC